MEDISNMSDREILEAIYRKIADNLNKYNGTSSYNGSDYKNASSETKKGTICNLKKKNGQKGVFAIFSLKCEKENIGCKAFDVKVVRVLEEELEISGKGHFSEWKGKEDFIINEIEIIGQSAKSNATNTTAEIEDEDVPF